MTVARVKVSKNRSASKQMSLASLLMFYFGLLYQRHIYKNVGLYVLFQQFTFI